MWQLFQNGSALHPGQEFYETSGTVNFMDGEGTKSIILHAFPDKIPEFNEFYILKLVNISGAGFFYLLLQNFIFILRVV
jgi:G-protein coupled receptor 98